MLQTRPKPRPTDRDEAPESPEKLPSETVFTLLQNQRRRYVLDYLRDADRPVELRELSERIAARETGKRVDEVTYRERKRAYTSLYQAHLPKLAEAGVVDYDRRSGVVSLAPAATDCFDYLSPPEPIRWWRRYLLVAALVGLSLSFAVVGLSPFAAVPGIAYAVAVVGAFGLLSIVYARRTGGD